MKKLRFRCSLAWPLLGIALASCETAAPPTSRVTSTENAPTSRAASAQSTAYRDADRPGLGTRWGETRDSRVSLAEFRRANATRPFATAAIHYNDPAGIAAMAGTVALERRWPILRDPVASLISVGLRDQSGRFLPGLIVGDKWFVVGEKGRRYSIVVRNRSDLRLEIALSVDGLDVIDGRAASLSKRGYIVRPHGQLTVDGFRQSLDQVAAFRFSSVRESYANQKYGETRNVGVIGIAVFNEYGTNPLDDSEARRRLKANPFPGGNGRFATPP